MNVKGRKSGQEPLRDRTFKIWGFNLRKIFHFNIITLIIYCSTKRTIILETSQRRVLKPCFLFLKPINKLSLLEARPAMWYWVRYPDSRPWILFNG